MLVFVSSDHIFCRHQHFFDISIDIFRKIEIIHVSVNVDITMSNDSVVHYANIFCGET